MEIGLILGDQLTQTLPTLRRLNRRSDVIIMAEVHEETHYVPHHRQKIFTVLSAMRHFAEALREAGWRVHYVTLDKAGPGSTLLSIVQKALTQFQPNGLVITEPGEFRLLADITLWSDKLSCPVEILEDRRFLVSISEFADWGKGKKQLRMEYFYRWMRQRTGLLMTEDNQPEGGQWNYDADNRQRWKGEPTPPKPLTFEVDSIDSDISTLIEQHFNDGWGDVRPGLWPVTREQALVSLRHAMTYLHYFGDYQDAMANDEPWLFHTRLSAALNMGLLDPREVCDQAADLYYRNKAPLNAVEGFIRQIIGWREFVRGLYWLYRMHEPNNGLNHQAPLPHYYWDADTRMHCVKQAVTQTRQWAYAHHIQRLMVTGNFALIAGLDPEAVSQWYLSVYIDAFQWVERPNTIGMALHADGGRITSKPYAASGQYINRMSNHCKHCWYDVKQTTGPKACPFNGLYWHFLMRHQDVFRSNGRMGLMYRNLDKKSDDERAALWQQGEQLIARLSDL